MPDYVVTFSRLITEEATVLIQATDSTDAIRQARQAWRSSSNALDWHHVAISEGAMIQGVKEAPPAKGS